MQGLAALAADPAAWAALVTLVAMELVLAVDNLVFVAIVTNKLPVHQQTSARRIGICLALVLRLGLLATITWLVGLDEALFGAFGFEFSWRDLILIAGGLFLVWKATKEIHHNVDPDPGPDLFDNQKATIGYGSAIVQILLLDMVFSVDSILTAVGMTTNLAIMVIAVIIAVIAMMIAADPLSRFVHNNPTVVMLALGFLFIIGVTLIADGFGHHVPKGYIYTAMAFSAGVEFLNTLARRRKAKRKAAAPAPH
jgi:predicted tellurium resistance membrane protein TerC